VTGDDASRSEVVLVRHGETEWTISGQHTSRTDVPLTDAGREHARRIGQRLAGRRFAFVLSSPMQRALETCRLAGFGDVATTDDDVKEWDYGDYEGRTTADIRKQQPDWSLWHDGVPNGETAAQVGERADRVIACLRAIDGTSIVFSHGHFLRVLAARWVELAPTDGARFALEPASLSVLGWERETPVLTRWNDTPNPSGGVTG
jgi:probable phosphoglycerate mutase